MYFQKWMIFFFIIFFIVVSVLWFRVSFFLLNMSTFLFPVLLDECNFFHELLVH